MPNKSMEEFILLILRHEKQQAPQGLSLLLRNQRETRPPLTDAGLYSLFGFLYLQFLWKHGIKNLYNCLKMGFHFQYTLEELRRHLGRFHPA